MSRSFCLVPQMYNTVLDRLRFECLWFEGRLQFA